MNVVLLHGALGVWDEVIFIGVVALLVVLMVISWVRTQMPEDDAPVDGQKRDEKPQSSEHLPLD